MFLILFSYVNFYDSEACSGGAGMFGKKVSKKLRDPGQFEDVVLSSLEVLGVWAKRRGA